MKADLLVNRLLEAVDPDDEYSPRDIIQNHQGPPNWLGPCFKLLKYSNDHEIYLQGRVTGHGREVHKRSTNFELELSDHPELNAMLELEIGATADAAQEVIQSKCIEINDKIYNALELQWDFVNTDEAIDEILSINDHWKFHRDGDYGGRIPFQRLSPAAKERARDWYRTDLDFDPEASDIIEEWKTELEEMGFGEPKIRYSGFGSQGDGASFTTGSFDLKKFIDWFSSSANTTERGHPYTDDLFRGQ